MKKWGTWVLSAISIVAIPLIANAQLAPVDFERYEPPIQTFPIVTCASNQDDRDETGAIVSRVSPMGLTTASSNRSDVGGGGPRITADGPRH